MNNHFCTFFALTYSVLDLPDSASVIMESYVFSCPAFHALPQPMIRYLTISSTRFGAIIDAWCTSDLAQFGGHQCQATEIEVEIEIMLEDLVLYHRLAADGEMRYAADDLRKAAQAHRELLLKWFTILDSDGQRLKGEFKAEDAKEIDGAIGQTELMRRTVRYQLSYHSLLRQVLDIPTEDGRRDLRLASGHGLAHSQGWHRRRQSHPDTLWSPAHQRVQMG